MPDRYSFFLILADVMIAISLLMIVAVLLLMVKAAGSDTYVNAPALRELGGAMLYIAGTATIFLNLLFITVGAMLHACVETARNTRAVRDWRGASIAPAVPT